MHHGLTLYDFRLTLHIRDGTVFAIKTCVVSRTRVVSHILDRKRGKINVIVNYKRASFYAKESWELVIIQ